MSATLLLPGFADPVRDAQAVFRRVMDAMARPGQVHRVEAPAEAPAPLDRATAAVMLTLVDGDTGVWHESGPGVAAWVAFHCGAPLASAAGADFAVIVGPRVKPGGDDEGGKPGGDEEDWIDLARFSAGTDEEPERGATVILQVAGLGVGERLVLSGPGLAGEAALAVDGLPDGFRAAWAENGKRFPRGVDVILCAGDALAALPRTVRIG